MRQIRPDNSKCIFPVLIPQGQGAELLRYSCAVGSWDHGGRLSVSEEDSKALAGRLRDAHGVCEEYQDIATASLIEIWIDETERGTRFLFEAGRQRDSTGHLDLT